MGWPEAAEVLLGEPTDQLFRAHPPTGGSLHQRGSGLTLGWAGSSINITGRLLDKHFLWGNGSSWQLRQAVCAMAARYHLREQGVKMSSQVFPELRTTPAQKFPARLLQL